MSSVNAASRGLALARVPRGEARAGHPVLAQRVPSATRGLPLRLRKSACRAEAGSAEQELEEIMDSVEGGSPTMEAAAVDEASPGGEASATEVPNFSLNFLWLDRNVAVAVDHCFGEGRRSPLTEYFFWPRTDAWEELKACLESKPWISERDKVLLLNKTTEVINFWQDETTKHTLVEAREEFKDCVFYGS